MIKGSALFLVVLGIGFAGMGISSSQAETIKGRTYSHPTLGFKILIPDGYQTSESFVGKLALWNGPSHKGFPAFGYPYLSVKTERTNGKSLKEKIEALRVENREVGASIVEDRSSALKSSRVSHVQESTYLNTTTKDVWRTRVIYVQKDKYFFRIGVTAIENDWKKYRQSWIEILESFEV